MNGNADYQPAPGYENRRHLIGPSSAPIWIGFKRDVPKLLTFDFWRCLWAWRMFHIGGGFPSDGPWTEQEPIISDSILAFEEHYTRHFSFEHHMIEAQNAIIRLLAGRRR